MDGVHLHYGSDGRDTTAPSTNFMYSGLPYDATGWTESTSGNVPDERRMLVSSGPVSFDSGDTATIAFAFIFTREGNFANGLTTSVARNRDDLMRIQQWFDQDSFPSCEVYTVGLNELASSPQFMVFPNPGTDNVYISTDNTGVRNADVTITNLYGEVVYAGWWDEGPINTSRLPAGMFFISIATPSGNEVHKWLKVH